MSEKVSINEIHDRLTLMMEWFHEYSIQHKIPYFMIGGTMLGAVRHDGFIPWDDDVDIGVPREDFERMLECAKDLPENSRYVFESYHDERDDFEYPFAKMYDTTTTLIENKRKKPKRGLFIDIFPIDGIDGKTKEEAFKSFKPLKKELNILAAITCEVRQGRVWWKNLIVKVVGWFPWIGGGFHKTMRRIDTLCKKNGYYEADYVGNLVGLRREREIVPKEYFGTPKLYKFEKTEFYGVSRADEYLTNIYGDWKKLPPAEKRKSDHSYLYLDLDHSYLEE